MQVKRLFVKSRGDTLIEVLFAISVFSLVIVGAISIMNQGINASRRALEITLVRNEIDAQAETLRFLNASYVAAYQVGALSYDENTPAGQWRLLSNSIKSDDVSAFGSNGTCKVPVSPYSPFILNTRLAKYITASDAKLSLAKTFSQVEYENDGAIRSTDGIWVEAVKPSIIGNTDYIDFHIRACWDAPDQSNPVVIGTIVRLYEPK